MSNAADPIFAAIDAHLAANAAVLAAVELHDILETELPVEKRRCYAMRSRQTRTPSAGPPWQHFLIENAAAALTNCA